MDLELLRTMILSRPVVRALASDGIDNQAAEALNAETAPVVRRIAKMKAMRWLAMRRRDQLARAVLESQDSLVRAMSQSAIDTVLIDSEYVTVDGELLGMFGYLVSQGVLTSDDQVAFLAAATEYMPVTERDLGRQVSANDVSSALRGDRPDGVAVPLPESP